MKKQQQKKEKRKEKKRKEINNIEWINMLLSTFIIQYYSKVVLIVAHRLNKIITIDMCVQFIIVTFYDELITKKVL